METSVKTQEPLPTKPVDTATDRLSRMAAIRQQIADGTYRIDSDALAESLIERLQKKQHRRVA